MIHNLTASLSKAILNLLFLLVTAFGLAQVGIGTNGAPAVGLLLEVDGPPSSSGVVLPEVDIVDLTTISPLPSGTELGTLVFNTNIVSGSGFYFWDGSSWVRFNAYIGQMAKFQNPSTQVASGNLNNAGGDVQIVGNTEFNDNTVLYQADGATGIKVNETGIYQVTVALSLVGIYGTSGSTRRDGRAEIDIRIRVAGADRGPLYRSTEMNMTSTNTTDNGSLSFTQSVKINTGQVITLRHKASKTENVGVVRLRSLGTSTIFIQKIL